MPLQKFRDRQKLIYWAIAIIVIPTFVLLGFTQLFIKSPESATVGTIYGKTCSYGDFESFYKRMRAISGGRPVYFTLDGYRPSFGEKYGMFVYMAMVKSAQKYGISVSAEEIDTFIRYQFNYQGNSAAELQKQVERAIGNAIRLDSVLEYRKAVEEWLLARKFLGTLDSSIIVPETVGSISFARDKAQYKYRSLTVPAAKFALEATKEVDAISAEDMDKRIASFISANQTESNRKNKMYPWLWSNPQWKFEYILAPFVVPDLDPKVTEEKLKVYYDQNKSKYMEKGKEKPFAEIRKKVEDDYRKQARMTNANQTIGHEFGRFLLKTVRNSKGNDVAITVEQIGSDARLVSLGMKAGVSGDKAMDSAAIMQNPVFAKSSIPFALNTIESALEQAKAKGNDEYEAAYNSYKNSFRGMSYPTYNGMGGQERPIRGDNGLYKIRIMEYIPAHPLTMQTATDEQKALIRKNVRQELIDDLAMDKARATATGAMSQMSQGAAEIAGIKVETKEAPYLRLQNTAAVLADAPVGKVFDPTPSNSPEGYRLLQLVERKIPTATTKDAVNDMETTQRMWRGSASYSIESSMTPVIKIGARFYAFYIQMSEEKQITASELLMD